MAINLDDAIAARDGLRVKLDNARMNLAALDEARTEIAFAAHTIGGDAEKQLRKMNRERLDIIASIETIEAAIVEASRRC